MPWIAGKISGSTETSFLKYAWTTVRYLCASEGGIQKDGPDFLLAIIIALSFMVDHVVRLAHSHVNISIHSHSSS